MRWLPFAVLLASAPALAGEDETRLHPVIIHATLDGAMAHVTARFVVVKELGVESEMLTVPDGALVTGATVIADGREHRLDLLAVADADEKWQAIESAPAGRGRGWAAKITGDSGGFVTVSLATPHAGFVAIDVEYAAPTCYLDDARWVTVPSEWEPALDYKLRQRKRPERFEATCSSQPHAFGLASSELAKQPAGLDRIGGSAGRMALGSEHVARIELDLAGKLGEVPRDLATVLLVDESRSIDPARVLEQRKLVAAYLHRVPDTRVQVLGFSRGAHAILPGWTAASQAEPRIERLLAAETLHNGSNLDEALAEAATWLAKVPGTHRIVVITDQLLPERLASAVASLRGALAPDTLVHVVETGGGDLERDDSATLAPLAAATFGMAVRGSGDVEMLVRPTSFDDVHLRPGAWSELTNGGGRTCAFADPTRIPEGESCTWWVEGDPSAGVIAVEGLVWGQRITRTFAPDLGKSRALARELSGRNSLDAERKAIVDREAHAVNAVWSLFGTWSGKGGYEGLTGGGVGWGTGCGCGDFGTIGHGGFGTANATRDNFEEQLAPALVECHAERDKVTVTLELTMNEIVEVGVQITNSPDQAIAGAMRRRHDCLVEAVWGIELVAAVPHAHANVTVNLGK